jgi:hypothetical protein
MKKEQTMKPSLTVVTVFALLLAGTALAAPKSATLTIRHQTQGCHSWSLNGSAWHPFQSTSLARGGMLTVVDTDVMPHTLIEVSGPKAAIAGAAMRHLDARARVVFLTKGTYVFKTKAGEDYMKGVKTTGEDNVLRLVVKVV